MLDIIMDTLIDGVKLLPFLFIAFLLIELIEHKLSGKSKKAIAKSGKYGPIIGSLLGLFPQCGFSVMATNLYVTRIITLGTLISVYLSTSDEMLPILLSSNAPFSVIIKLLAIKVIIGMSIGFVIDLVLRKRNSNTKSDYHICSDEHCHCEKGIFKSTLIHTFKTLLFIIIVSFVLNLLLEYKGIDFLSKLFLKNSIFGSFVSSLVGLVPNCAASVMITELYLSNAISFGSTVAGLLTGSGVAILVLFKTNKNMKENMIILGIIYFVGALSGMIIDIIGMVL